MNTLLRVRKQSVASLSILGSLGLGLLLSSCTTSEPVSHDSFFQKWSIVRDQSLTSYPVDEVFVDEEISAPGQPLTLGITEEEEKQLPTKMIKDLVIEETEVSVVLRALAKAGDQNILVGDNVSGNVVFNFTNVPWDQAFQSVLSSSGLTYQWEGDIIRVLAVEDMQKELEMERLLQEQRNLMVAARGAEPLNIEILKIRFTDAQKLAASLQTLLDQTQAEGSVQRSSVTVDEDNNSIIIHAGKSDIEKISRLVRHLDRPKPQVLIEAKIVEANRSTARELGVQWGGFRQSVRGERLYGINSRGVDSRGLNLPANLNDDLGLSLGFFSERVGGGELLDLQLTALEEDGQLNILSRPSITTLDNQKATIESGEERAFRETSGTGNDLDVSVEWKKAVLRLEVTPHVIDENTLKIEIKANKDSFDETKPEANGEFPVNTKMAQTTLLLRNGETTVIGGLSQESDGKSNAGVPYLKDIPFIGEAFKRRRSSRELDDILIFITPHILTARVVEQAQKKVLPLPAAVAAAVVKADEPLESMDDIFEEGEMPVVDLVESEAGVSNYDIDAEAAIREELKALQATKLQGDLEAEAAAIEVEPEGEATLPEEGGNNGAASAEVGPGEDAVRPVGDPGEDLVDPEGVPAEETIEPGGSKVNASLESLSMSMIEN